MHIPDAYLSPSTQAATFAAMVPFWAVAMRRTRKELSTRQTPLLAIGAGFCFTIQMFNVPTPGGTSAHALGTVLLAILVGPWAALLGLTLSLAIQALMFGDGGILSLGANSMDMGLVAGFVGYGVYRALCSRNRLLAAGLGAYVGTVAASLCAGLLLGIQPAIAHDAGGHALYCPFGLNITVPAMVVSHLLVAAPADAIFTVATLSYLWRAFPEQLIQGPPATRNAAWAVQRSRLARYVTWAVVLTPFGLLAGGDAFGEWDSETLSKMIGYLPAGFRTAPVVHAPLPDYGFAGGTMPVLGYVLSAFIGCSCVVVFAWVVARRRREPTLAPASQPTTRYCETPPWLLRPQPVLATPKQTRSFWVEGLLLRIRATTESAMDSEQIARGQGALQAVHPMHKAIGFLLALVATSLAASAWVLAAMLSVALVAARLSKVPLKPFVWEVGKWALVFGLALAGPVSLHALTPGPIAFSLAGIEFSTPGLFCGGLLLLRLATGIALTLLWRRTTPWRLLLASLRRIGVPGAFLTMAMLAYRYLFVSLETAAEMAEATTSRMVGACDRDQARLFAGSRAATLFAKSLTLMEETHMAMRSRCFESTHQHAL